MRPWLLLVLGCLVAGALVNVAVAFGCALWSDLRQGRQYAAPSPSEAAWWKAHAPAVIASDPIVVGLRRFVRVRRRRFRRGRTPWVTRQSAPSAASR